MRDEVEEYFSDSTIDNPPREPKEGAQADLFDEEGHESTVDEFLDTTTPDKFEFKLTLVLKAARGNTNPLTIPVASGTAPAEMVEDIISKQFGSQRFRKILRAIVSDETQPTEGEAQ